MADLSHQTREFRRGIGFDEVDDDNVGVRDAVRSGFGIATAALVFYVLATVWVGTCTGSIANAAGCGAPQRAMLTLGAPAILFAGGLWSLARGMRMRRDHAVWFASGSVLLALMVLSAAVSFPSLAG